MGCEQDPLQFIQIFGMNNFFTPIEVSTSADGVSQKYELDKFKNDPFSPTTVRIQSLGDHRKKTMQWLKSMPQTMRMSKLTFVNKQFSCLLISMYDRLSSRSLDCLSQFGISYDKQNGFRIVEQRFISKPNPKLLEAENKLISSIVVANRYSTFDSISVDLSLVQDIDRMFELFDIIENGITHEITKNNYQNFHEEKDPYLMFFNPTQDDCTVTKTLGLWFVQAIKKNISVQFFREYQQTNQLTSCPKSNSNETAIQQKQTLIQSKNALKQKKRMFKNYWNRLSAQNRQIMIKKVLNRDIRKILTDYMQTIKVYGDSFPFIKYCHQNEHKRFVNSIVKLEGEYLLNELTYTKLEDASYDIPLYKYQILLEIQEQIEKNKNKKTDILNIKKKNKVVLKKKTEIIDTKKTQFIQQKLLNKQSQPTKQKQSKPPQQKKPRKKPQKPVVSISQKPQSETTNDQESDNQYLDDILESQKKQAQQEFNKILHEFDLKTIKWNKYQQIAINRLATVLQIYNLSFQLFGSYANGLAISSSDVDVCVDPNIVHFFYTSFCTYREKVIMGLEFLKNCFQMVNWASNFKIITTASVPLLVFEIDLSIPYGDPKNPLYNPNKLQKSPKICVDLTIEPFANMQKQLVPHLGYESTALVAQWLAEYKNLGQIVRILKHLLNKNNLNKSFLGGISSYALTSLVYSYMKSDPTSKQKPLLDVVLEFCLFIEKFSQTQTIVDVSSPEPFQKKKVDRLTVVNYLNSKNLTENCYRFSEIKDVIANLQSILNSYHTASNKKQYPKKLRSILLQ